MKTIVRYIIFSAVVFLPITSNAFKLKTHVWVGQQVINDLADDGRLSFDIDGTSITLDVPLDVKNSILLNKPVYLMGNIGPDAIPDVVVGQMAVHPGVVSFFTGEEGWLTDDWLQYLLRKSVDDSVGKALAYGFLGHAAADSFAHTYMNVYSGDTFLLTDGEVLVEQRHWVLEGFIDNYAPPLIDHLDRPLGNYWDVLPQATDLKYARFVRDNLIYDQTVTAEYKKQPATLHMAAFSDFRKAVDAESKSDIWLEMDDAALRIVAAYFGATINAEQATKINEAVDALNQALTDGDGEIQELTNSLNGLLEEFDSSVFGNLNTARTTINDSAESYMAKHLVWLEKLAEIITCPRPCFLGVCLPPDPVCEAAAKIANEIILEAAKNLFAEVTTKRKELEAAILAARNEVAAAIAAIETVRNSLIDFQQMFSNGRSPIQNVLVGWRDDIDEAMVAYVKATSQSMINTMNPDASAIEPITKWFDCYQLQMIGLPSNLSGCQFRDSLARVKESLAEIIAILDQAAWLGNTVGIPSITELKKLLDTKVDQLVDDLKKEVAEKIEDILPQEVKDLMLLVDAEVTDATLRLYFTKAEVVSAQDKKGLFMLADIASIARKDMGIAAGDLYYDPAKFSAVNNAVVMAKLALLDQSGLRQLGREMQANTLASYTGPVTNVVAQAFASIDGNHNWMPLPPPLPNILPQTSSLGGGTGVYPPVTVTYSTDRRQVTPNRPAGPGFLLWDGELRDEVFRKLFKGPMTPGMDEVVARDTEQNYPYIPCKSNPFPDDINDDRCVQQPIGTGRITQDVLAFYDFSAGAGNVVVDRSGVNLSADLTISGDVEWTNTGLRFRSAGTAISPGRPQKILDPIRFGDNFSVEAWITPERVAQLDPGIIAGLMYSGRYRNMSIAQNAATFSNYVLSIGSTYNRTTFESGQITSTTTPMHIVMTRSQQDQLIRFYVDGVETGSAVSEGDLGAWANHYSLVIGSDSKGLQPWMGEFHLLSIYGKALTAAEVLQNFAAGTGR